MKNNEKGFTLMEMLIVVAIIAVLVAIAIPVLSNQLEKSRETADLANMRNIYAELMIRTATDDKENHDGIGYSADDFGECWLTTEAVDFIQKQEDWQMDTTDIRIGQFTLQEITGDYGENPIGSGTFFNMSFYPDFGGEGPTLFVWVG